MATKQRKIFISYRRDDNHDFVERIWDWFTRKYGRENVFLDIDTIRVMVKFAPFIRQQIEQCDAVVVIIGPKWVELLKEKKAKNEPDFVQKEVALALRLNKSIAPILIIDAEMPKKSELPRNLRSLLEHNAVPLRSDPNFVDNIGRIIDAIEMQLQSKDVDATPEDDTSIEAARSELNLSPFMSFLMLGAIKHGFGDLDEAILNFNAAIQLNPQEPASYRGLGDVYYDKKQYPEALKLYEDYIRLTGKEASKVILQRVKKLEQQLKRP